LEAKTTTQSEYGYEVVKGDIEPFLKLYRYKAKGMSSSHLNNLLEISNNDLPAIKSDLKHLNDTSTLQFRKHICEGSLYQLNNQISTTNRLLNSYRLYCEKEKSSIEQLYNEQIRIENFLLNLRTIMKNILRLKRQLKKRWKVF
jgi:hypothetical protein